MNYLSLYKSIIQSARKYQICRKLEKKNGEYFERHHIIPECMGGSNHSYNKVLLTAREHFLVHRCLAKAARQIYGDNHEYTFKLMTPVRRFIFGKASIRADYRVTAREYEFLKSEMSRVGVSPETRAKCRESKLGAKNHRYGTHPTEKTLKKLRIRSGKENNPNWGKSISMEQKKKIITKLAQTWKIYFSDDRIEIVYNLKAWSKNQGYNAGCVHNVYSGRAKTHKDIIKVIKLSDG